MPAAAWATRRRTSGVAGAIMTHLIPASLIGPLEPRKRLSAILGGLAADLKAPRIHVAEVLIAVEDRAFGALLLFFALPNLLPTPPGAGILGLPLVLLSLQLAMGRSPWLPRPIHRRSLDRHNFVKLTSRMVAFLERSERWLRPRISILFHPAVERLVGMLCLILSILLFLPIPFGNMLPALAICLIALGLLERDGLWLIGGAALGCASMFILSSGLFFLVTAMGHFAGT